MEKPMVRAFFAAAAKVSDDRGEFNVDAVCRSLKIGPRAGLLLAGRLVAEGMVRPINERQYQLTRVGVASANG